MIRDLSAARQVQQVLFVFSTATMRVTDKSTLVAITRKGHAGFCTKIATSGTKDRFVTWEVGCGDVTRGNLGKEDQTPSTDIGGVDDNPAIPRHLLRIFDASIVTRPPECGPVEPVKQPPGSTWERNSDYILICTFCLLLIPVAFDPFDPSEAVLTHGSPGREDARFASISCAESNLKHLEESCYHHDSILQWT